MDEKDFIAEIVANPDSVAPRLIYADWLSEQGDPRGEFIQVECQLDELDLRDPKRIDLEYRQRALLAQYRLAWSKTLRQETSARSCTYRRGLIEQMGLSAERFIRQHEEIFACTPLRGVRLYSVRKSVEELADCPGLARLTGLDLRDGQIGIGRLRTLLQSPYLSNLTRLGLGYNGLSDAAMPLIAKCRSLSNVRALDLDQMSLSYDGIAQLSTSELGRNLRELSIASTNLSDENFRTLHYPDVLPKLESLNVAFNDAFLSESVQRFFFSKQFRKLRHLSMRQCNLQQSDITYLGGLSTPLELRTLNLDTANLREQPATEFATARWLRGLVELSIESCRLDDAGLSAILHRGNVRMLRTLNMYNNNLDSKSAIHLAVWPDAVNLTRLDLRANKIGSDGVEALARSPYLCNLNELDLRSNDIDDAGIRSLIESTTLDRLTQLRVTYQGHDKKRRFRADLKRKLGARFGPGVCRFD